MLQKVKNRKVAAIWAFVGVLPLSLSGFSEAHLAGLHRFYLREYGWGLVYLFFGLLTPIPWIAGVLEGIWYLVQDEMEFDGHFNQGVLAIDSPTDISTIGTPAIFVKSVNPAVKTAEAIRELDRLRQDGLLSEYEFEQKRRQLINSIH